MQGVGLFSLGVLLRNSLKPSPLRHGFQYGAGPGFSELNILHKILVIQVSFLKMHKRFAPFCLVIFGCDWKWRTSNFPNYCIAFLFRYVMALKFKLTFLYFSIFVTSLHFLGQLCDHHWWETFRLGQFDSCYVVHAKYFFDGLFFQEFQGSPTVTCLK